MCNITGTTRRQSVTGYKVAAKRGNGYYSMVTGIKYEIGEVKVPKRQRVLLGGFIDTLLDPLDPAHVPQYAGMTGVFARLGDARSLRAAIIEHHGYEYECCPYDCVILKMTLRASGKRRILAGAYHSSNVYVGPVIGSIEEIKE
jgi:hypothetical protein